MIESKIAADQEDACAQIGGHPADIPALESGKMKFTLDQIEAACSLAGVSADYILGFTAMMMRAPAKDPLEAMKDALIALQAKFKEGV